MAKLVFDNFEIDLDLFRLQKDGVVIPIGAKPLDLLIFLIENRSRVASKTLIRENVWAGISLSEATIPTAIMAVRKALGDASASPQYILSERARGYRFAGSVQRTVPVSARTNATQPELPLVGRQSQISEFDRVTRDVEHDGSGRILIIRGEAGIGKSRLLSEFIGSACPRFETFETRGAPFQGTPAYWPWVKLLKAVLNDSTPRTDRFSRLFANLSNRIPELAEDNIRDGDGARISAPQSSFQEWTDAIVAIPSEKPVVLIVDDVHRLDHDSLVLLYWVADEIANSPILLVIASRPNSTEGESAEILSEIERLPNAAEIVIPPLQESDVRELLDPLHPNVDALARTLISRTGGNPFYLTQLLSCLDEIPDLDIEGSSFEGVPLNAKEIVAQRLAGLPARTKEILSAASVLGDRFDAPFVSKMFAATFQISDHELIPAIDAWILREEKGGYAFNHALLREALYRAMPQSVRQEFHLRAANQLIDNRSTSYIAAEISHHLARALPLADPELALHYSLTAARDAAARLAYAEARRHLLRSLQVLERGKCERPSDRAMILIELAEATLYCGDRPESRRHLLEAAHLARSTKDWTQLATCALGLAPDFLSIEVGACDPTLIQMLSESLENTDQSDLEMRATLLARLSQATQWTDDSNDRTSLADRALVIAHESESNSALLIAYAAKADTLNGPHHALDRLAIARSLGEVARRTGDLPELFLHHTRAISAHVELGDLAAAERENQMHKDLAEETQLRQYYWLSVAIESMLHAARGELREGAQKAEEYLAIAGENPDANVRMTYGGQMLQRAFELDNLEPMVPAIRGLASQHATVRFWKGTFAWLLVETGAFAEASRILSSFREPELSRLMSEPGCGLGLGNLAVVASKVGTDSVRRRFLAIIDPLADRCVSAGYGVAYFGAFSRYAGLLQHSLGRSDLAVNSLKRALESETSRGLPSWRMYAAADLLIAQKACGMDLSATLQEISVMQETYSSMRLPRAERVIREAIELSCST